ncbi:MAG: leucine-rich repeat domain-containing protein, partial [Kiritimatiellae bacterium]|nr:leucine-rich repeat domain-containing protein [Kiritimatiellia bacterium]
MKKRNWAKRATVLLAVAMCIAFGASSAWAATQVVDGITWTYSVSGGNATVAGADPTTGALAIPSTLGGCPVTSIGQDAFSGFSMLTSVTIPDSVTSIGAYAFSGCTGLAGVTVPDSVKNLEEYAFYGCESLTDATILGNVTNDWNLHAYSGTGPGPFSDCTHLSSVTLGGKMEKIGNGMFMGCRNLK